MTQSAEAMIAEALLASLDGPSDPDAEQAWATEIERRVKAFDAGTEPLESWDEVKRQIASDALKR